MTFATCFRVVTLSISLFFLALTALAAPQSAQSKKVFIITDMEGVDGVFNEDLQVTPNKSPRWEESLKMFTEEVNAAVSGLFAGGATDVVVWDGHWSDSNLSARDIHPRARLLTGQPVSPTLELDPSYSAVIFIGQHAMAGAEKAVLSHSYAFEIQNIWVNNKPTGEIGARTLLAGAFGIPVIMLSGDTAACKELHDLVPQAECAEVKTGVSRTAAYMLSHSAACDLIQAKAKKAMERLPEFKPYKIPGPVEVKVEFTPPGTQVFKPQEGVERINDRTWAFRGKDILEAWLKYSEF
jgi:D-amino peptidase